MSVLRRRWPVVALVTTLALVGTLAGLLVTGRKYLATTTLRVPAVASDGVPDLDYVDRLTNTYQQIAESDLLRAEVQRRLGTQADLKVIVEPLPNTELMRLTVETDDAELAQEAANAWATALVRRVEAGRESSRSAQSEGVDDRLAALERRLTALRAERETATEPGRRAQLDQSLRVGELRYQALAQQAAEIEAAGGGRAALSVAEPALTSVGGFPGARRSLALGLFLGLLGGVGVALLLERRAPQLDTLDDIERVAGRPVLATVPLARGGASAVFNGGSRQQEAFGNLRAHLLASDGGSPRTILVASAHEGDGKSVVAANLAAALARARRPVLIIDGDLRRPTLHSLFGVSNDYGLGELLQREDPGFEHTLPHVRHTKITNLDVLPSGPDAESAAELLASPRMTELIARFKRDYDFVVVDSPGLLDTGDAAAVAAQADAVVFIVSGTPVSYENVHSVRRQLESLGARNVGVVVNRWNGDRPGEGGGR